MIAQTSGADTGVLDLRNADFFADESIELIGDWEFYWNELLNPGEFGRVERRYEEFPQLWNDMDEIDNMVYASYRLIVLLPDSIPPLALSVPDMYSSYRLFANGEIISENGKVDSTKAEYIPKWKAKSSKSTMLKKYDYEKHKLLRHLENWSEKDISRILLPHPVLGKLSVREMMFFTIHHNDHHFKQLEEIESYEKSN